MKRNKIITIALTSLVALMLCIGTVFAYNPFDQAAEQYQDLSEEEFVSSLNAKTVDELLSEANSFSTEDTSLLIFYANALFNKREELTPEKLFEEIVDVGNSVPVRVALLQIDRQALGGSLSDNATILALLGDGGTDFEIKRNILINLYGKHPDSPLITDIAKGNDDRLSFHAIKMLSKSNPEEAVAISNEIIQNRENYGVEKLRAAIKAKALELRTLDSEPSEFIDFCDEILAAQIDAITSDTVIFALSRLQKKSSIEYIVNSDLIDSSAKCYCIDENYQVLEAVLTGNPTSEDVQLVASAMLIYPLKELAAPLQALMSNGFIDDGNAPIVQQAIGRINEIGEPATNRG